jgi:hypothetical protein
MFVAVLEACAVYTTPPNVLMLRMFAAGLAVVAPLV